VEGAEEAPKAEEGLVEAEPPPEEEVPPAEEETVTAAEAEARPEDTTAPVEEPADEAAPPEEGQIDQQEADAPAKPAPVSRPAGAEDRRGKRLPDLWSWGPRKDRSPSS
jgi:hypothetical protein